MKIDVSVQYSPHSLKFWYLDIGNSSVLIADAVALATTKCYICVYSEKNGVQMPGGTDKCIDPHGGHETLDIGVDQCRGMCYVSKKHTK